VQGTVSAFDDETHDGRVLLDDGVELPYDADAFASGGLRLLRVGQRVRLETTGETPSRRVTFLTVLTLPDPR